LAVSPHGHHFKAQITDINHIDRKLKTKYIITYIFFVWELISPLVVIPGHKLNKLVVESNSTLWHITILILARACTTGGTDDQSMSTDFPSLYLFAGIQKPNPPSKLLSTSIVNIVIFDKID
jgi:hypothetical protein